MLPLISFVSDTLSMLGGLIIAYNGYQLMLIRRELYTHRINLAPDAPEDLKILMENIHKNLDNEIELGRKGEKFFKMILVGVSLLTLGFVLFFLLHIVMFITTF